LSQQSISGRLRIITSIILKIKELITAAMHPHLTGMKYR
jgi:hypothetical protein